MGNYNNDGYLDLYVTGYGSAVLYHSEVTYKESKLMFRNLGHGKFAKMPKCLGQDFIIPIAGRGLAAADFDNDGNIDFAVVGSGNFPQLLRNDGGNTNNWLTVSLVGTKSNRDGLGSVLKLTSEDFTQFKQGKGGMSYMSAGDPRIHFGLGKQKSIESFEIIWPTGHVGHLSKIPISQFITVK